MIAKTLKHWQGHLAALTTALTLGLSASSAQAVDLPAPGYDVDGFAIFYSTAEAVTAADRNHQIRTGSYYEFGSESDRTAFVNSMEPVLDVTGVDLDNLPVPFLNQLDSVSLSGVGNSAWHMDLPGRREAVLSNLVLDIKTMTLWGDLQVNLLQGVQQTSLIGSRSAFPIFKLSGGVSAGVEFRPFSEFDDLTTPWWPEDAPFAQPTPVGPLGTLPYAGLHHFASMGPDSALIWLPGLLFTPEARALGVPNSAAVGDMLIAVQVSAVPEAETQALAVIGLLLVGAAVRRRGRHRRV